MRSVLVSLAVLAFCGPLSAEALAQVAVFRPTARAQPVIIEEPDEIRTAPPGGLIHRQFFAHDRLARVDAVVSVIDGSKTYTVAPSNLMYGVNPTEGNATAFCTFDVTYAGRNGLGILGRFPTCLVDRDGDGSLDTIFASLGRASYGRRVGDFRQDVSPSVTYSIVHDADPEQPEFGIQFERISARRFELQLVHLGGMAETELIGGRFRIPETLPATLNILGAEIEVLAIDDNVLTYRLRTGFNANVMRETELLAE